MNITEGEQDLVFLDFESMFRYLWDLEDHLIVIMVMYPEYIIKKQLYTNEEDLYTIRLSIRRDKNYTDYEDE